MKTYILVFIISLFLLGCGDNNNKNILLRDGKGDIDVVKYLPSVDMIKYFTYVNNGGILFGGEGRQEITILENKINIIQYAHMSGRFNTGDITQKKFTITYNDMNITKFTDDENKTEIFYRHVDKGEILSEKSTHNTSEYIDSNFDIGLVVGKVLNEKTERCFYKEISDKVVDSYGDFVKNNGSFLVIQCNTVDKKTYQIEKKYRDQLHINDKSNYTEIIRMKYYEKDVGLVYESAITKSTRVPCRVKSKCLYDKLENHYNYNVQSVDY